MNGTLPDGGPFYYETNLKNFFVEPWNAISALLFIAIGVFWLIRLKGRYKRYGLIVAGMSILVIGGIGGAIYHGFRFSSFFLYMDVVPIFLLAIIATIYLWNRIVPHWGYLFLILPVFVIVDQLILPNLDISAKLTTNLEYVNLGVMILTPLVAVLFKTKFRYVGFVVLALASFFGALYFRELDGLLPNVFSMGTHWLWHTFGAFACLFFIEYLYRLIRLKYNAERLLRIQI